MRTPHGDEGEVELTFELVAVDLHIAFALDGSGNVDAGDEGGQLGRSGRVKLHADAGALDGDDAEIDGKSEIDLEDKRVVAGDARAEDLEDLVQAAADLDGSGFRDIDAEALGRIEHGPELELRLARRVADEQARRLVANDQRSIARDGDDGRAAELYVERDRRFEIEQDDELRAFGPVLELDLAAVPDDVFDGDPRNGRDGSGNSGRKDAVAEFRPAAIPGDGVGDGREERE